MLRVLGAGLHLGNEPINLIEPMWWMDRVNVYVVDVMDYDST